MSGEQNNLKHWIRAGIHHWYLFVILFPMALGIAFLFLQRTPKKYEANASLLIRDEEGQLNEEVIFSEFGLGKRSKNLENEVLVLKSSPLMTEVVRDLELQYTFTEIDGFRRTDLYKHAPISVSNWIQNQERKPLEALLYADSPESYRLEMEEGVFNGEFGKELVLPQGTLTLIRENRAEIVNPIEIRCHTESGRARELGKILEVEVMGENSSVVHLSIKDTSPERAKDILNGLIAGYNEDNIQKKNAVFENSIRFIDDRVKLISGELSETESSVENYKRQYNVVELSTEGNMILSELTGFNKRISDSDVQMEILNSIHSFLLRHQNSFEFVPTNLNLTDLTLTKQLEQFNQLLATRDKLKNELGAAHPDLILAEKQIENLRMTIINSIHAIKKDLEITMQADEELKGGLEARLQSLPKRERELIDIERKKDIKEKLYIYLLQKREEAALSLSVNRSSAYIVEPPFSSDPVSPKPAQVWLIAAFLGLAIPASILLVIDSTNNKIREEEEVQEATDVPVIGVLAQTRKREKLVATGNNFSLPAEMFRLLRSNLTHLSPNKHVKSLMITSSVHGEGKSYIALNLAMTEVLTGKRVVIVNLDLRNNTSETYWNNAPGHAGVADYLSNSGITLRHIIQQTSLHPCLDIISNGGQVSNPSQMVFSNRLRDLVNLLKKEYDLIILDTPPVGLVTDTFEISDLAEATMYVVRMQYTQRSHLQIIDNINQMQKLPQPFIVLNGAQVSNSAGFVYSFKTQQAEDSGVANEMALQRANHTSDN